MKFAVCVIAYQDEEYLGAVLNSFPDHYYKLVLVSEKPWFGPKQKEDDTFLIATEYADRVEKKHWEQEHEQRNHGLNILRDYDYVWVVDADELYDYNEIENIEKFLQENPQEYVYCGNIKTYWKTPEYEVSPQDNHKAVVLVNPKKADFTEHRNIGTGGYVLNKDMLTMHHLSYAHSDKKIKQKITNFSHANEIYEDWYEDKWLAWNEETKHLHPYSEGKWYQAINKPLPKHMQNLIKNYGKISK